MPPFALKVCDYKIQRGLKGMDLVADYGRTCSKFPEILSLIVDVLISSRLEVSKDWCICLTDRQFDIAGMEYQSSVWFINFHPLTPVTP